MGFKYALHHKQGQHQCQQDNVVIVGAGDLMAEKYRLAYGKPERPIGEESHLVDQNLDDGAERQGHHRQIRAIHTQCRQGEQRTKKCRDHNTRRYRQQKRHAQLKIKYTGGIGTNPEQCGVTE